MGSAAIFIKKYLPYVIVLIAVIGFLAWSISSIYKAGEESKNAEWLEKDAEQREALTKAMAEAMQNVAEQRRRDVIHTMEVINERNDQINRLNSDSNNGKRVRVHTQSPYCNEDTVPGKNSSSSDGVGPASEPGIRVSGKYAEELYVPEEIVNTIINDLHRQREELKIYFKACAAELRPLVEVLNDD